MTNQNDKYSIFADRTKPVGTKFRFEAHTLEVVACTNIENPCFGCIAYYRPMLCTSDKFRLESGSCIAKMRSDRADVQFKLTKSNTNE